MSSFVKQMLADLLPGQLDDNDKKPIATRSSGNLRQEVYRFGGAVLSLDYEADKNCIVAACLQCGEANLDIAVDRMVSALELPEFEEFTASAGLVLQVNRDRSGNVSVGMQAVNPAAIESVVGLPIDEAATTKILDELFPAALRTSEQKWIFQNGGVLTHHSVYDGCCLSRHFMDDKLTAVRGSWINHEKRRQA